MPTNHIDSATDGMFSKEELVQEDGRWLLRHHTLHSFWRRPKGAVPALDKGIRVLSYINHQHTGTATLADVASALDLTKSHCHGILKTLVAHDWLYFDTATRTYRLNAGILRDLAGILENRTHVHFIRPLLERIGERTGVPTIVTRPLPDGSFVVVDKISAPQEMEISYRVGHLFPRDAAAQMRASLAWQPQEEIDAWLADWQPTPYSVGTITDIGKVRLELSDTKARGYARSVGEFTDGLMAMALPIYDADGVMILIMTCISTQSTLSKKERYVASELVSTAEAIHSMFGSAVPEGYKKSLAPE